MPDEPGSLERAANVITKYDGNINRIQYDRRIDPCTVFYEVTTTDANYRKITSDLEKLGYLQNSLQPASFLKFFVHLPHTPGSLSRFLKYTTKSGANIGFIDFDDTGRYPDRLTVSLNLENPAAVDQLLDQLKSRYHLEILEYDITGKHLDDTIFYVRFAQEIRDLIGESENTFLLSFLADTNHIAQELMNRGNNPQQVFDSVLQTGRTLRATTGKFFYADIQKISVTSSVDLFCFQLPCGGNIYVLTSEKENLMIDTGYGIYHDDVRAMFLHYGLGDEDRFTQLVISHADADHCGAGGFYSAGALMHPGTRDIIKTNNRAYGSRSEHSILEAFYTKMINLFSRFCPPKKIHCLPPAGPETCSIFPVLGTVTIGDISLEILEGLGGHTHGQIYLYSRNEGLLFTADAVINFSSLTPDRAAYNSLADFLVTSVNVDSDLARRERKALLELAADTDQYLSTKQKRCRICGGHGAVSVVENGKLAAFGDVIRYKQTYN
ncbi:MBL fold metallo-hydrolase [Methanoregula sp.]|uniref:MBL fold metallo-hydrolase n=1 Tax=Methanoregula sp. TaxID=2052170 RepID=UPI002C468F91|nr:MBL fold metallo-hydrolase [Methanoregula sp.]HVP95989.1 MBL fold metallo-hydrolase [Methanoregula sp.]